MKTTDIKQMLAEPTRWFFMVVEPIYGLDYEMQECYTSFYSLWTIQAVLITQRKAIPEASIVRSDEDALLDFMAVHWVETAYDTLPS